MQFGSRISRSGERFLFLGFCPGMIAALQFRDPCSVHVLYPSFLFIFFLFSPIAHTHFGHWKKLEISSVITENGEER